MGFEAFSSPDDRKHQKRETDLRAVDREYRQPEGFEWQKTIDLEGSIDVVDAILGKKFGVPEYKDARVVIPLGSGGLASVFQTGLPLTLERQGLVDSVDTYVGYSGGATEVLYAGAGHAFKSAYMWMAAGSDKLGSLGRWLAKEATFGYAGGPLVDIPGTVRRARNENERSDLRFAYNYEGAKVAKQGKFFVVAWDIDREETVYIDLAKMKPDPKSRQDPVQAAEASANVGGLSGNTFVEVEIDGEKRRLTDVGMDVFDIDEMQRKFNPTHMLIVPSQTKDQPLPSAIQSTVVAAIARKHGIPEKVIAKFNSGDETFAKQVELIRERAKSGEGPKVLIAWPRRAVNGLNASTNEMRVAARDSIWAFSALFEERKKKLGERYHTPFPT